MVASAAGPPGLGPGALIAEKYQVERILGRGGMGVVVAARHLGIEDRVAIKLLLPELARNDQIVGRFLAEARAARRLRTEHVARVTDVGTLPENGAPYMVMELLEGADLNTLVESEGPLALPAAVEYLLQACVAIAEAHSLGIIHRDIKPGNLFLSTRPDGSPCIKVLDFGIAKILGGSSNVVATHTRGGMLGTTVYAPPEQLRSAKHVDVRSDIWSLGVTLYELVTNRLPFDGDDVAELVARVISEPHTPIRDHRTDLPEGVVSAIDRCLAKDPADRYQDVSELARALEPFGGGESARSVLAVTRILHPEPRVVVVAGMPEGSAASKGAGTETPNATLDPLRTTVPRTARASKRLPLRATLIAGGLLCGGLAVGAVFYRPKQAVPAIADPRIPPSHQPAESLSPATIAPEGGCVLPDRVPDCADPLVIDDMEDGNGLLCPVAGRSGHWVAYGDGSGQQWPPPGKVEAMPFIPGCRGKSARGLHVVGKGFRDWGVGVVAKFSETLGQTYDLTPYAGVRFWAHAAAPARIRVQIATKGTLDQAFGGACEAQSGKECNDHFTAMRVIGTEWSSYTVRFSQMAQDGYGVRATFDLHQGLELHFAAYRPADTTTLDFDLWIDDVTFLSSNEGTRSPK